MKITESHNISAIILYTIMCAYSTIAITAYIATSKSDLLSTVKLPTSLINYTFTNVSRPTGALWLPAAPSSHNRSLIWYPFNNWRPWKNRIYAFCSYEAHSKNLTVLAEPCGRIPSDGCLNAMLNVSVRRGDPQRRCEDTVYNPMLYNIPRWGIHVIISGTLRHLSDSQSIIYMGLSTLINKLLISENCSHSTIFPNALRRNLFQTYVTDTQTKDFFTKLKFVRDTNSTTFKRYMVNQPPITPRQFSDLTVLMYYLFSFGPSCEIRDLYNEYITSRNSTAWTRYGYVNISSLYIPSPFNMTSGNATAPRAPITGVLEMLYLKKFFYRHAGHNLTVHRRPVISLISPGSFTGKGFVTDVF